MFYVHIWHSTVDDVWCDVCLYEFLSFWYVHARRYTVYIASLSDVMCDSVCVCMCFSLFYMFTRHHTVYIASRSLSLSLYVCVFQNYCNSVCIINALCPHRACDGAMCAVVWCDVCVFVCVSLFFMCSHSSSHCLYRVSLCVCSKTYFNSICINNVSYVHIEHSTVRYVMWLCACVCMRFSLFDVFTRAVTLFVLQDILVLALIMFYMFTSGIRRCDVWCDVMWCVRVCVCVCSKTYFNGVCINNVLFVHIGHSTARCVMCDSVCFHMCFSLRDTVYIPSVSVCVCVCSKHLIVFALIMFYMFTSECVFVCVSLCSYVHTRGHTVCIASLSVYVCVPKHASLLFALIMFICSHRAFDATMWCDVLFSVFVCVSLFLMCSHASSCCLCRISLCVWCVPKHTSMVFALIMFYMFTSGIQRCDVWCDMMWSVCLYVFGSFWCLHTSRHTVYIVSLSVCVFQNILQWCFHY